MTDRATIAAQRLASDAGLRGDAVDALAVFFNEHSDDGFPLPRLAESVARGAGRAGFSPSRPPRPRRSENQARKPDGGTYPSGASTSNPGRFRASCELPQFHHCDRGGIEDMGSPASP